MFSSIVVFLYVIPILGIATFSIVQLNLMVNYWFRTKTPAQTLQAPWPRITVQLPIYNEQYVVARLIEAVVGFDYPKTHFEIQILDDSTDETVEIIAQQVAKYQQQGFAITQLRRPSRAGFKAGALAHGLIQAQGEFIAIFDADFVPKPDFLRQTLGHFANHQVGVVQTRWAHLNEPYSWLTQFQAMALDAHFTVEQAGRNAAGHFINFNGTAGVWRKSCIEEAGGWSADTLTEDLDLSYRAQLKGWQFVYLEDIETPAELPATMPALKSQQYRWAKGGTECMKKNALNVLKNKNLPFLTKLQGVAHLWSSSIFVWSFMLAAMSLPMLWVFKFATSSGFWLNLARFGPLSLLSIVLMCATAASKRRSMLFSVALLPFFLSAILGLSLHNSTAVLGGWFGKKTPFVRTPKWGIQTAKDQWQRKKYLSERLPFITFIEIGLAFCFVGAVALGLYWHIYQLLLFHAMLAFGFGFVGYYSVKHSRVRAN